MKKYWTVQTYLLNQIKNKELRPGDRIPSSKELQKQFGVSAVTVRRAVTELIDSDILFAVQGSGTFVKQQKIVWRTTSGSFFKNIRGGTSREERPEDSTGIEIKEMRRVRDKAAAQAFGVSPDTEFTMYLRVRTSADEPVAVSVSYLPLDIIDERDYFFLRRNKSLYRTLRGKNIFPTATQEIFSVEIVSNKEIYSLLHQNNNAALLCGTRLNYDDTGRIFEYTRNYFLADRYMVVCWDSERSGNAGVGSPAQQAAKT